MRKRSAVALLLAAGIAFSCGCSGNQIAVQSKRIVIDVIVKKTDADFWKVVKMGTEAAGREFNVTVNFKGPLDETKIDEQIRMVDDAVNAGADAIVLAASDYTKLAEPVERAAAAGVPVIMIDSDVKSEKTKAFVGTDNVDAGRRLGDTLVLKVGSQCEVAVMGFVRGAATCDQREQGLMEVLGRYPGIKVLDTVYCNSDESYARILTQQIMEKHPGIDAIVCLNAYGTVGVARCVEETNKGGAIKVIGLDSTPTEIRFLETGVIQALVIQNPYKMGYLGVKHAVDAIYGKPVPKNVNTGSTVIDSENMYLPENQKLLFPFTN